MGYAAIRIAHIVFTSDMERDLVNHVKLLADTFHGLSILKCSQLAYNFAAENNLMVPKYWELNQRAGKDWWQGFKVHRCSENGYLRVIMWSRKCMN